jgi:hypothetical protein
MNIMTHWFVFVLIGFVLGYLLGRIDALIDIFRDSDKDNGLPKPKPFSFTKSAEPTARKSVTIDERKYVAPISTDGLAKAETTTLGKTTTKEDDIQASVSKLAQLKGK